MAIMRYVFTTFFVIYIPVLVIADTIWVPDDYPNIQQAIDAAMNGDTVLVQPGIYVENIDFLGKAITVKSEQGADVTVIDGGSPVKPDYRSCVLFQNKEGLDSLLEGFTLTNGMGTWYGYSYIGGAINCYNSSPTIANNTICDNSVGDIDPWVYGVGGGIYCGNGSFPNIINNNIIDNSAENGGGGICCDESSPTIKNNNIAGNTTDGDGGGINSYNSSPIISNNIIAENTSKYEMFGGGGGIVIHYDSPSSIIYNNTIMLNSTSGSCGGILCSDSSSMILNNIISNNTAVSGGGIGFSYSSPTIMNNIISDNSVDMDCGGIGCFWETSPNITGNIISNNLAAFSCGGFGCWKSTPILNNNTIVGNSANNGVNGIGCYHDSILAIRNTILWDNIKNPGDSEITIGWGYDPSTVIIGYSDLMGGMNSVNKEPGCTLKWRQGMIDSDPIFVDAVKGDYHLTFNSPCRGSGDNSAVTELTDFEGDPRIAYGTVDMGADEFYTHLYWTGDATPGGNVEIKFVGLPGNSPVGLCIGSGFLDAPIPSMWGDWYLKFPIFGPIFLGKIPTPAGILILKDTIPIRPPAPFIIPLQALIGDSLSNLCVISVN
jgi:hypothetical protein